MGNSLSQLLHAWILNICIYITSEQDPIQTYKMQIFNVSKEDKNIDYRMNRQMLGRSKVACLVNSFEG